MTLLCNISLFKYCIPSVNVASANGSKHRMWKHLVVAFHIIVVKYFSAFLFSCICVILCDFMLILCCFGATNDDYEGCFSFLVVFGVVNLVKCPD